jgi:penicillin amidase
VSRDSYHVAGNPSMRIIVPLGDPDGMRIIGPLGQSGQPGHRHYNDMTDPWIRGELVPLPLTRTGVERVTRERLVLTAGRSRAE